MNIVEKSLHSNNCTNFTCVKLVQNKFTERKRKKIKLVRILKLSDLLKYFMIRKVIAKDNYDNIY